MDALVFPHWLADRLGAPGIAILDASKHLPDAGRDARAEFATLHVPGARFLDLDSLVDPDSIVPSALPTPGQFAASMRALGVNAGDRIVFYDDSAIHSAARAWFMARMHRVAKVSLLDGGLARWRELGLPLESGDGGSAVEGSFAAGSGPSPVRSKADMLANLASGAEQVVDARGPARFSGEDGDFRAGVAAGQIPGSRNLPHAKVFAEDGTFLPPEEIRAAFAGAGIDLDRPFVASCGSGVTASVLLFAAHLAGADTGALYDGSWSEWGADPATPKATGAAR